MRFLLIAKIHGHINFPGMMFDCCFAFAGVVLREATFHISTQTNVDVVGFFLTAKLVDNVHLSIRSINRRLGEEVSCKSGIGGGFSWTSAGALCAEAGQAVGTSFAREAGSPRRSTVRRAVGVE